MKLYNADLMCSSHRLSDALWVLRRKTTEPSYEVCSTRETPATQLRAAVTVGQINVVLARNKLQKEGNCALAHPTKRTFKTINQYSK